MAVKPPTDAPPGDPPPEPKGPEVNTLPLLDHLKELRYRLMVSSAALILGILVSLWPLTGWFIDFLVEPAESRVEEFELIFTEPLEYWTSYFRVSLLLGAALAMPVIIYQALAFVGPALTTSEKRWMYPIVIGASLAFVAGGAFAYYIEMPPALNFLFDSGGRARPLIRIRSYIDFATRLIFFTGLVFELPLVVMGLAKIGIVTSRKLWKWKGYALILAFVLAAVVTPSPDPITQSIVAGPIIVLYIIGIALAKLVEGSPIVSR